MWLLDHNIPRKLKNTLKNLGVTTESAVDRGWETLENGDLVAACVNAGFKVLLTRDRRFQESAAKNLKKYSEIAVVLLIIPQAEATVYCEAFEMAWKQSPITPTAGKIFIWPSAM